jgi:hypothetical protein
VSTIYLEHGNTFIPRNDLTNVMHPRVPAGTYIIEEVPFMGLGLTRVDDFILPAKLYGNTRRVGDRIVNTFNDRVSTTGVLLSGEKGSGKTLLAKYVANRLLADGAVTLLINKPIVGDKFNTLLQMIEQPIVVIFDEFDKTYDDDEQQSMLTMLDGTITSKKLFIFTCNDRWRVNQYMRNRPGRIYYAIEYHGLTSEFVREYAVDALDEKYAEYVDGVVTVASMFPEFNFDMLQALVEEMNRYGEPPAKAIELLNVKFEYMDNVKFQITVHRHGMEVKNIHPVVWSGNPIAKPPSISWQTPEKDSDGDPVWEEMQLIPGDIIKVDRERKSYTFSRNGLLVEFTRLVESTHVDYSNLF